ncbi:MAG: helix-turn-helix domain-containing protein [Acidobacteria bacterium]|nr:helix-turn-helix domain-containing protein [Acidobacteriota bacterium]MBV9148108.1 helix-turn-helix domain-containing protein [Acidobacteriota bacterium]
MRAGTKLARPEWAVQIERLRERLHLNQAGLARLLNVSPMAVSRWERAVNEPEAAYYIHMGTLAGDPDCWYFWQRAGLPASDLKRALRKTRAHRSGQTEPPSAPEVSVPLLALTAGTVSAGDNTPNLEQAPAVAKLAAPGDWSQNDQSLRCLRVAGDGMAPLIADGSIVAVDLSQFEPAKLSNAVVLAWHKDYGLMLRRLKRFGAAEVLVAETDRAGANTLTLDRNWRLLGRAVWWMSRPK